jgi:hypothetical protein
MKLTVIIGRIVAVFGSSALAAIAGGAVIGIELWKSAAMAGFMAAARVIEALLRMWADDGVLSREEVQKAFTGK